MIHCPLTISKAPYLETHFTFFINYILTALATAMWLMDNFVF